jgi:hypothetical protein
MIAKNTFNQTFCQHEKFIPLALRKPLLANLHILHNKKEISDNSFVECAKLQLFTIKNIASVNENPDLMYLKLKK